jgi:predicted DCC family thiol-disulfide oxidoreductase YuxK
VKWIIKVDKKKTISFCALQSRAAEPYLLLCGLTRADVWRRFVFIEGPDSCHQASTAALKVASYLPFPYSALSILVVVPTPIRDAVYDYVAKRRYHWFGKSTECITPTEDVLDRFVDKLEIQERMTDQEQSEEEQVNEIP